MPHRLIRWACPIFALLPMLTLAPTPTPAGAQSAATAMPDVQGNVYTSPTFGFALSWDDSWRPLGEKTEKGLDILSVANGTSIVTLFGQAYQATLSACVQSLEHGNKTDPSISHEAPLLDGNGSPIAGANANAAFEVVTSTIARPDGTSIDVIERFECRPLLPKTVIAMRDIIVGQNLYDEQMPLIENLLIGLSLPSPGEPAPAFVAGPWRLGVVAAVRAPAIASAGLTAKTGKDWLLVVADVTDWSTGDRALSVSGVRLRLAGGAKAIAPARALTAFGGAAADSGNVAFTAGQTQRVALAFQIPSAATGPALTLGGATMPLAGPLALRPKLRALPATAAPPHLLQATVARVVADGIIDVTIRGYTMPVAIAFIGVAPALLGECFADRAAAALKKLTAKGASLGLEADPAHSAWYVWLTQADGTRALLNARLLADGDDQPAPLEAHARFAAWLGETARAAQTAQLGRWKTCAAPALPSVTPIAATPVAVTPAAAGAL